MRYSSVVASQVIKILLWARESHVDAVDVWRKILEEKMVVLFCASYLSQKQLQKSSKYPCFPPLMWCGRMGQSTPALSAGFRRDGADLLRRRSGKFLFVDFCVAIRSETALSRYNIPGRSLFPSIFVDVLRGHTNNIYCECEVPSTVCNVVGCFTLTSWSGGVMAEKYVLRSESPTLALSCHSLK